MKTRLFALMPILVLAMAGLESVNASDVETLLQSAGSGDYTEVKRLIEKGVDVDFQVTRGYTALMIALATGHTEIAILLIESGADADARDNTYGQRALILASRDGRCLVVLWKGEYQASGELQEVLAFCVERNT